MFTNIACIALATTLSVITINTTARAANLQTVDSVLEQVGKRNEATTAGQSEPAKLLADIIAFRATSAKLTADRSATQWLALWDRSRTVNPVSAAADYNAFDVAIQAPVGSRSVIAAIPSPESWPAIRQQALERAKKKPDDVATAGLKLIAEILTGDTPAVLQSLLHFDRLAISGEPSEREFKLFMVNQTRSLVFKLYGTRKQIAESFQTDVEAQARQSYPTSVGVPDLVGLLGADKAEALLRDALRRPVSLHVSEGAATRILARRLALTEVKALRKPQWELVDSIGTSALYEALRKRFDPGAAKTKKASADEGEGETDYSRREADLYYFLDLVIAGRHDEAEQAMVRATAGNFNFSVPKQAMAELVRNGGNTVVYSYLANLLTRRPQLPAWDTYLEQASYLGHSKDALALLDTILKRSNLAPYLRADLSTKRLDALLAADRVEEAMLGFQALLSAPPTVDDPKLEERCSAAIRLAGLGRVLKQPAHAEIGFSFAKQALALPLNPQQSWRPTVVRGLLAELRRQGRAIEAQQLALTQLDPAYSDPRYIAFSPAIWVEPAKRAALVELAGIYDSADRPADVLRLLNEVGTWGVPDLRNLIAEKDSLGTPLGFMAAHALQASGNLPAARLSVLTLLDQQPGYDPAYQLLIAIDPEHAINELDRLYALDQFEERPLIWKASALNATRQYDAAESTIRRAIAIDPSDGEQGANDRMRAYAVLAQVLEAKGDKQSALGYQRAVTAIRLSEQADEMHKLGLYQRAFAGYRAALDEFSGAYCIQSRLAVQLGKLGFHEEALKHYRRAFELMPDSFGRVESHCFGCESIFAGPNAQQVAEQVFTNLIKAAPRKPQASYMLGYLRKEQQRYDEAVNLFQQTIALDPEYLNAWKRLYELGELTYIDARERDIARLKLFELDPRQMHVKYQLDEVANLAALWRALAAFETKRAHNPTIEQVYPLARSARERDDALTKLPSEMRQKMTQYLALQDRASALGSSHAPAPTLAEHELLVAALRLMGDVVKQSGQ